MQQKHRRFGARTDDPVPDPAPSDVDEALIRPEAPVTTTESQDACEQQYAEKTELNRHSASVC